MQALIAEAAGLMRDGVDLDAADRGGGLDGRARAARKDHPARPADRPGAGCGVLLRLSASAARLARGGGRGPAVLSPCRRGARPQRRCLLAARRLSGAARGRAWPRPSGSAPACRPLPRRSPCMANAGATWRWARRWSTRTARGTGWRGFWGLSPATRTGRCIWATGAPLLHAMPGQAAGAALRGTSFTIPPSLTSPTPPWPRSRDATGATVAETGSYSTPVRRRAIDRHLLPPDRGPPSPPYPLSSFSGAP